MDGKILYPLLSTGLVLVTLFISYLRKTDTDNYQRKVYFIVLAFIYAAILTHSIGTMLEGRAGSKIHLLLLIIFNFFIIFQQASYYLTVVFLDYLIHKNNMRTKKFIYIITGFMAVNIIILAVNYFNNFYFYITENNYFMNSSLFLVRFYMSYSAVMIAITDIFLSKRQLRSVQISVIVFFAVLSGAGAVLDIILPGGNLIWAFLTTAMLIAYLFIIHSDTTQDAMTGIGNRASFVEFMNQITQMKTRQSYAMALFNINDFKKINNEYGLAAGDMLLAEMAMLLKKCTRRYDFIARMGDDKFLVAIKAQYKIEQLLSRILNSLDELNQKPGRRYIISVSYGYDTYSSINNQSSEDFLQGLHELVFLNKKEQYGETPGKRRDAGT